MVDHAAPSLVDTVKLITRAHAEQKDKIGAPYHLHPIRVASRLGSDATDDERTVALLHDVLEDTGITSADLLGMGYGMYTTTVILFWPSSDGGADVPKKFFDNHASMAELKNWLEDRHLTIGTPQAGTNFVSVEHQDGSPLAAEEMARVLSSEAEPEMGEALLAGHLANIGRILAKR